MGAILSGPFMEVVGFESQNIYMGNHLGPK